MRYPRRGGSTNEVGLSQQYTQSDSQTLPPRGRERRVLSCLFKYVIMILLITYSYIMIYLGYSCDICDILVIVIL